MPPERDAGREMMRGCVVFCSGCSATAQQKALLASLGITHVLNAADGPQRIDTGPLFYSDTAVEYHGVPAADRKDFDLTPFFGETAEFIHRALSQRGTETGG